MLSLSFIEHAAASQNISLRTGCMCNPGGTAALLGLLHMAARFQSGMTMEEFERLLGREIGLVRISLGLATNFEDVFRVIRFAQSIARQEDFERMWRAWTASPAFSAASF